MAKEINASNKTCVVIGNGFDINLGLPTSYNSFVDSKQFNDLLQRGNKLAVHLKDKYDLQNWIDIENELKAYSDTEDDPDFKINFETLRFQLINYLNNLDYRNLKTHGSAYNLLSEIAKNCHNYIILDFNYTKSIEYILRSKYIDEETIDSCLVKVHGEASNNDIIFGIEDGLQIKKEHVFLRKAYPLYYKGLNLPKIFEQSDRIIIFGHSLGETDHTYFHNLFRDCCMEKYGEKEINKEFQIFYYKETGYDSLMQQIDYLTNFSLAAFRQHNTIRFMDVAHLDDMQS